MKKFEYSIPFNKPSYGEEDNKNIAEALANAHISGDGPFSVKCHNLLESVLSVPKVLLTTSCTHALEMAAMLLDIKPGDEVIIPSFTFVSVVNAFVLRGAIPVFIDIRPDTLNMDETQLEQLITPDTKAIVPVHYAGVGCEMDSISETANHHGIPVIEDNAHGLFGKYNGKFLGTFGKLATQSFHETKNFTCGEGGALIINDPKYVERAEIIREKGTNRSRFFRGQVDKYTWVDVGSSYLPSDVLAAMLFGQLEAREVIQSKRKRVWEYYNDNLAEWADTNQIQLPTIPENREQTYHMYYMLMPSMEHRQGLIAHLKENGIQSVFHYLPLHLSDMGRKIKWQQRDLPTTEQICERLIRLPFYNNLSETELNLVVGAITEYSLD